MPISFSRLSSEREFPVFNYVPLRTMLASLVIVETVLEVYAEAPNVLEYAIQCNECGPYIIEKTINMAKGAFAKSAQWTIYAEHPFTDTHLKAALNRSMTFDAAPPKSNIDRSKVYQSWGAFS